MTQQAPDREVGEFHHDEAARALARRLWRLLEVVHTPMYFSEEVAAGCRELGLQNRMQGYCATRTFPLGVVPDAVVAAVFYGFAPRTMALGLPAAWEITTPQVAGQMTRETMGGLFARLFDGLDDEVARAAELAREAALLHPTIGRPLAAAWASQPWDDDPAVMLWQAAGRIRESRGDGHVALLVAADIDGVGSHLTLNGDSPELRERMGKLRGWTDPEWDAGVQRLRARGMLGDDGSLTAAGRALRDRIEAATDDLAAAPWQALGVDASERLAGALTPLVQPVVDAGILPRFITRRLDA